MHITKLYELTIDCGYAYSLRNCAFFQLPASVSFALIRSIVFFYSIERFIWTLKLQNRLKPSTNDWNYSEPPKDSHRMVALNAFLLMIVLGLTGPVYVLFWSPNSTKIIEVCSTNTYMPASLFISSTVLEIIIQIGTFVLISVAKRRINGMLQSFQTRGTGQTLNIRIALRRNHQATGAMHLVVVAEVSAYIFIGVTSVIVRLMAQNQLQAYLWSYIGYITIHLFLLLTPIIIIILNGAVYNQAKIHILQSKKNLFTVKKVMAIDDSEGINENAARYFGDLQREWGIK